ncbi:MAG: hypothetical protein GXO47_09565 [Chlorobi bacterium]|nr:hypothetical protein [Chlorobiota bacterium]
MKTTSQLTRKEKDAHVEAWQKSRLAQHACSIQANLKYSTFKNWICSCRRSFMPSNGNSIAKGPFILVVSKYGESEVSGLCDIQLTYPNSVKVSCSGIDINQILQLIKHYRYVHTFLYTSFLSVQ